MGSRKFIYKIIYSRAKDERKIHWHKDEIPCLLTKSIESLGSGKALDVGCGTGVNSVFMAQNGFMVTAVDFIPEALDFARKRARQFGIEIRFILSDATKLELHERFNLVLDCGCLHSFDDKLRIKYKEKLLSLMSGDSEYVLVHCSKSKKLDFGLGPKPKTRDDIENFFAPELDLVNFIPRTGTDTTFCQYRFVRRSFPA
jgi:SAM-dependent methyltransferase